MSCETVTDYRELAEILASVSHCKVVLLDEVNFVKDWDRAVKHAVDSGQTRILMVTGSHSYDLKRGADQMPGRFDAGGEFLLLPMGFEEFSAMRAQAGWQSQNRLEELRAYFRVGGFPTLIIRLKNMWPCWSLVLPCVPYMRSISIREGFVLGRIINFILRILYFIIWRFIEAAVTYSSCLTRLVSTLEIPRLER